MRTIARTAPYRNARKRFAAARISATFLNLARMGAIPSDQPQPIVSSDQPGDLTVDGSVYVRGPSPWIDARTYGVSDHGQEVATELQEALDAAAVTGGTVLVPDGDYVLEETLQFPAGVFLQD